MRKVLIGRTEFVLKLQLTQLIEVALCSNAAKTADVVIMNLGHALQSGSRSRTDLGLPGLQQEPLEEVYKVNPNVVLF
jgi:beta-glucosidase